MTKKVPLSVSISEEARKILEREAAPLADGDGDRVPLGDLLTELIRYFDDVDDNWEELREDIIFNRSQKVQERRRRDRERKRRVV
jgi:hypothetical protein